VSLDLDLLTSSKSKNDPAAASSDCTIAVNDVNR
jgi:hypothetical protein